ncbi:MAG: hypothetical protein HYT62_03355 [Candidatus Yanofskybacteria bacterium]|nr:hypothetical protein [Candidatus Yanofskybacteria bacterium]
MKIKSGVLNDKEKDKFIDMLYVGVGKLKSQKDIKHFLRDFLTESEKIMIGRRMLIAQRLLYRQPYDQIVREMGVGLDTIYKIRNWLNSGPGGHKDIIPKLKNTRRLRKKINSGFRDYYVSGPFAELRKRYRSHYWLADLLEELNR